MEYSEYSYARAWAFCARVGAHILMAVEVEGQFAGVDVILQRAGTRAFAGSEELGTGLLSVEERFDLLVTILF